MTNLMLEIDEAMRWERIEKLWKTYGNYIAGGILILILGVAAFEGYRAWDKHVRAKSSERFLAMLQDKTYPDNVKTDSAEIGGQIEGIALIMAGGDFLRKDKPKEALELFERAANDKSLSADMRGLGALMRARLLSADPANKEDLAQSLQPILKDGASPWRPYALMEAAAFSANRDSDFTQARRYLKEVIDADQLPQSLYAKASALDQVYAMKQKQNGGKTDQKS